MIEPLFGAGTPMWTSAPPASLAFQGPLPIGSGPIGTPMLFGPAQAPSLTSAPQIGAASLTPTAPFAYGPPPSLVGPPAFARPVSPYVGAEPPGAPTATALLTAVAMYRGQPQGPTNDQEIEEFIYDGLELLAGASDVEVRCEGGRVTLTGTVQHKRVKHDVGEIAWAIPAVNDVQNNVTIASRRRSRAAAREGEAAAGAQARKQS